MFVPCKPFQSSLMFAGKAGVSLTLSDVILAQSACPLSDVIYCLHSGITNYLYTNIALRP